MQAPHVNDDLLQREYDGDLQGAELTQLQAHLATCHVCSARRAAFARLSKMVADAALAGASGLDSNALFARIERGIAADGVQAKPSEKTAEKPMAPVVQLSAWRKLSTLTAAGAGLAVAAAVLLMVYKPGGGTDRPGEIAEGVEPSSATSAPANTGTPEALPPGHSEVVQVDFGNSTGTVFDIAMADGSSTPVVWINDDE